MLVLCGAKPPVSNPAKNTISPWKTERIGVKPSVK